MFLRASLSVGLLAAALLALVASPSPAAGQTIVVDPMPMPEPRRPEPRPDDRPIPIPDQPAPLDTPLTVKQHEASATIVDGVATTTLQQVFHNNTPRRLEGTYVFPLPDDVALQQFSMWMNGEEVQGQVLPADEARQVYWSIVRKMRDPALLEYAGQRMFRARLFPIEPNSDIRIKLSYSQLLETKDGLVGFVHPLGSAQQWRVPILQAGLTVKIKSKTPISSVFCPTHNVAISRASDHEVTVSYEDRNVHSQDDLQLYYALSDKEFGLTVLTYREAGEDGFFLARLAPPAQTAAEDILPKDICFVIDTSGSMGGEKIEQARRALKYCIGNLSPQDRFNVVPFSHEARRFAATLVPADSEHRTEAMQFADQLEAVGGTNIHEALLTALQSAPGGDETRPYQIVFLTDGQPTVGVTETRQLLKDVADHNAQRVRLFVFGVGYDVNTQLLDLLAEQNHGTRDYVEPGEDLELKLSHFYRKVASPVLAGLALNFPGLNVYDVFPKQLPDLFAGSELVVTGRYQGEGAKAVELTGTRRGTKERFVYETSFPSDARDYAFLPPLWATRKVGYLLDQLRLHGENDELKQSIITLATKYGIVTPYTSYLVTESVYKARFRGGDQLARAVQQFIDQDSANVPGSFAGQSVPPPMNGGSGGGAYRARAGRGAVAASQEAKTLQDSAEAPVFAMGSTGDKKTGSIVRRVESRTFYRIEGVWTDSSHKDDAKTVKVEVFSPAYFELLDKHPELGKVFALGERVIVVVDGTSYETTVPAKEAESEEP